MLREETKIGFSAEELTLATIPGADFEPSGRHFSVDELRPQPIIKKGKKVNNLLSFMPCYASSKNNFALSTVQFR